MNLGELKDVLVEQYLLELATTEQLVICSYTGSGDKRKARYISKYEQAIPTQDLSIMGSYTLMVKSKAGNKREGDMSCDSKFMEKVTQEVGRKNCETYYWVSRITPIFFYLNNAISHGKNEAVVDVYVKAARDDLNVICFHQHPHSPVTNILDLGVWIALQNVVEKLHLRKRIEPEALCNIVEEAWKKLDPIKLQNVYDHWKMVLDLMIEDNGGDMLAELKRGNLYHTPLYAEIGKSKVNFPTFLKLGHFLLTLTYLTLFSKQFAYTFLFLRPANNFICCQFPNSQFTLLQNFVRYPNFIIF